MKKMLFLFILVWFTGSAFSGMLAPDEGLTPLMEAARTGTAEQVKTLLKQGAELNAFSRTYHRNALMIAARENPRPAPVLAALLAAGADIDAVDRDGNTALLFCCGCGYSPRNYSRPEVLAAARDAVLLLMQNGANINNANDSGETPLMAAARRFDAKLLAEMIQNGAEVNVKDHQGRTPLMEALSDPDKVRALLEHEANPNARDYHNTPLAFMVHDNATAKLLLAYKIQLNGRQMISGILKGHGAIPTAAEPLIDVWCRWADPELVQTLLEQQPEITEKTLQAARENPHREVLKMLLDKYLEVHAVTNLFRLQYAVLADDVESVKTTLDAGIKKNDAAELLLLLCRQTEPDPDLIIALLEHHADVNAVDSNGNTPLMLAAGHSQSTAIAELLIKHGADVNATDRQGRPLLHRLAVNTTLPTEERLNWLELLRHRQINVNALDNNGATALLLALGHEQPEPVIRALLALGIDINQASKSNVTPLMLAARHYPAELVNMLLLQNAKINAVDLAGWTPLFYAAEFWRLPEEDMVFPIPQRRSRMASAETIRLLRERGAPAKIVDLVGNTPLFEAAGWADPETLQLLLKSGLNVNAADQRGRTPLMNAVRFNPDDRAVLLLLDAGAKIAVEMKAGAFPAISHQQLADGIVTIQKASATANSSEELDFAPAEAAATPRPAILQAMLQRGLDPKASFTQKGRTTTLWQVTRSPAIKDLLTQADVKAVDTVPHSTLPAAQADAFLKACGSENGKTLAALLSKINPQPAAARANLLDSGYRAAVEANRPEVVKWLVEQGAPSLPRDWVYALNNADHPETLEFLIDRPQAMADLDEDRQLALFRVNSAAGVKILLKHGFNVNVINARQNNPLLDALNPDSASQDLRSWRLPEVVEALLQGGADADQQDRRGWPLLAVAVTNHSSPFSYRTVRVLLRYVKNVDAVNPEGDTALSLAVKNNDAYLVELLLAHGAHVRPAMKYWSETTPYIQQCLTATKKLRTGKRHQR